MILCIEDNVQNMRLTRKMLKIGGYEMAEAEDGLTGVEKAIELKPDLILVDINLPDIDGTEVTARLKAHPETMNIPVIALKAKVASVEPNIIMTVPIAIISSGLLILPEANGLCFVRRITLSASLSM